MNSVAGRWIVVSREWMIDRRDSRDSQSEITCGRREGQRLPNASDSATFVGPSDMIVSAFLQPSAHEKTEWIYRDCGPLEESSVSIFVSMSGADKRPKQIFRIGRGPDPWQPPGWSHAHADGTFGNRFDDPVGYYRVLYAASQAVSSVAVLASLTVLRAALF